MTSPWMDDRLAANGQRVCDNFMAWFGRSAVTSELGHPLMVVHGTLEDFDQFVLGKGEAQSRAFFFADVNLVDGYIWSYLDALKYQQTERHGDHTFMPVYLSIKNPMRVKTNHDVESGEWADPDFENEKIELAKSLGHDGVIFKDDHMGTTFYVAFDARQIKSAIGNTGLYLADSASLTDREAAAQLELVQMARQVAGRGVFEGVKP